MLRERRVSTAFAPLLAIALVVFCAAAPAETGAFVRLEGDRWVIGNELLERHLDIGGGTIRTTRIVNRVAGIEYPVDSIEFVVRPASPLGWGKALDSRNTKVVHVAQSESDDGSVHLVFGCKPREGSGPSIRLHYEVAPDTFYMHKWLSLGPVGADWMIDSFVLEKITPKDPQLFSKVELWPKERATDSPWQQQVIAYDLGQPVYADTLFLGTEYPAAQTGLEDGAVVLGYKSGMWVPPTAMSTRKAVLGVAPAGGTARSFFRYIDEIRGPKLRPFLLYNTWFTMGKSVSEKRVLRNMEVLKEQLVDKHGVRLDSYVIDDGWDDLDDLWRIHEKKFPHRFDAIADGAAQLKTRLGLWYNPQGNHTNGCGRSQAAIAQGFERSTARSPYTDYYLCLQAPKYNQRFRDSVRTMISEYRLSHLKFDGLQGCLCNDPTHGHRTGEYAFVGMCDAWIEILEETRRQSPDISIIVTNGSWPSPWWLMYCDAICAGLTGDHGQIGWDIRDKDVYNAVRRYAFPIHSMMLHGIAKTEAGNARDFKNQVMMYVGRGLMLWELYITPQIMTDEELEFLAETLAWAEKNAELLATSQMILGNPFNNEVYGYMHLKGGQGYLFLRNPANEKATAMLDIERDVMMHEPEHASCRLNGIYPADNCPAYTAARDDTVTIEMEPDTVMVYEVKLD
jgi:hypothetical protein